jgi:hypothetical protein
MMLEPVMIVRLDMMNRATTRLATSLAIFSDSIGVLLVVSPFSD